MQTSDRINCEMEIFNMNTSVKMLVTDLDDTLLKTDKTVSNRTKTVLNQCREAGIKIVYATGRGDDAAELLPVELFNGRVVNNGATAAIDDTVIYSRPIPYETARPILLACDRRGLQVVSQNGDMNYANYVVSDVSPLVENFEIVDFALHDKDAEKIYINNCIPDVVAFIESLLPDDLYLVLSRNKVGQIMHRDATKAKGVAALAKQWGIAQSEVVAFGDDLNDKDMLLYAGIGVAMGNALEEIKAVADSICSVSDKDGIAEWISTNLMHKG